MSKNTRAVLKGLCSIDLNYGPPEMPPDPEDCWIVIQAGIGLGEATDPGEDTFTFYVCTPKKLAAIALVQGYEFGRHLIILESFDWGMVEQAIETICEEAAGETWKEIAEKIGRYGYW